MPRGRNGVQRREARRHWLILVLLAQLAFGLALGLRYFGLLPTLERGVYDVYLQRRADAGGADPGIVVVEYAEADEARYGYPLPDHVLAELLERLAAARPLAIGLDLIRDRPEPQGADLEGYRRLVTALRAHDLAIGIVKETEAGYSPPPALAERPMQIGFADIVKDPDGVVRRGLLYLTTPAGTRPSLALQLAGRQLQAEGIPPVWEDDSLRLGAALYVRLQPQASSLYASGERSLSDGGYQFLLTFPTCPDADHRLSVDEVLTGAGGEVEVANRLVLIGNTVRVVKDQFPVPVDCRGPASGEIFGVHLHAQIASQLIHEARGTTRPIQTLAQRFRSPVLGQAAELGWTWLWSLGGGLAAPLVGSPLWLAAALATAAFLIVGASLGAFFMAGLWLPVAGPLVGAGAAATLAISYVMTRARHEREELMRLLGGAVSHRVALAIWQMRAGLGGRGRPPPELMMATVLFSDIRAFSRISTMLPESRLATWLDLYMEPMVDVVERHGGVIEKFAGDGLTVEFGVPEPRATDAEIAADARAAVECALAMADSLRTLNRTMAERDLPKVAIRVGIHSGPLMAGVIGGARRWQYSIIGDTANTAARLEAYGKDDPHLNSDADHCRILISEGTYHLLEGRFAVESVGTLEMRNRGPISVYRVTGRRQPREAEPRGTDQW